MRLPPLRGREEELLGIVGERRREKALRFFRADDRLRCLAAGYLMREYLPGFSEERLTAGRDGKPFLPGGAAFSVSHGGDYAVLALCEGAAGVGVDVEPIREMAFYREILPRYTTPEEREAVGESAEKAVWVWTRKESLYKCFGEGVSDLGELPAVLEDRAALFGQPCRLRSWGRAGHVFSAAVRGSGRPFELTVKDAAFP